MPEDAVAKLGALFDRTVFEAVVDDRITILNEAGLIGKLKLAAENCDARGYRDDVVEIEYPPGALAAVSRIGRLEQLQEEIRDLRRQTVRLARDIETLRDTQPLRDRLKQAESDYTLKIKQLNAYELHREALGNEADKLAELKRWMDEAADWTEKLEQNDQARTKAQNEGQAAIARAKTLSEEDAKIRQQARVMPSAAGDATGPTPVSDAFSRLRALRSAAPLKQRPDGAKPAPAR